MLLIHVCGLKGLFSAFSITSTRSNQYYHKVGVIALYIELYYHQIRPPPPQHHHHYHHPTTTTTTTTTPTATSTLYYSRSIPLYIEHYLPQIKPHPPPHQHHRPHGHTESNKENHGPNVDHEPMQSSPLKFAVKVQQPNTEEAAHEIMVTDLFA